MRLIRTALLAQMQGVAIEVSPVLPARSLPLSHMRLDVAATSMDALFAVVAQLIAGPDRPRPEQVVQRLWRRHQRSSPVLGLGLALPHAAVPVIRTPLAVYLRLRTPCRLLDDDEQGVTDCLALLVPTPGFLADHELLTRVSNFFRKPENADVLRACTDEAAIRRCLTGLG